MTGKLASAALRLGKISYVNTAPFYHGLFEDTAVTVLEGSPAEINRAMREGRVDFAPISSLEYALAQDQYLLFPGLCIGSRDFARSVLLISREKIERLDRRRIALSEKSASAQALVKILLRFQYRFQNEFETSAAGPEEMLTRAPAALVIGDEALFWSPQTFVYKYDLSELWFNWLGLPFCFAVWAVRRAFAEAHPEEATEFYARLKRTLERNTSDLEGLLRDGLNMTLADKRFPQVYGYLFNLNFCLDEEMLKGLAAFYDYARRLELAPPVEEIRFLEAAGAVVSGT